MTKGIPQVREGIPIDALTEAKKSYENAKCKISRRNDKGQIAMVYGSMLRTIDELFDIDSWLGTMAGGGEYRIEARDPNNPATYIVPPFKVKVEGAPHKPKFLGNPVHNAPYGTPDPNNYPQPPGGHGMFDPNQPPPPPWLQGVHPAVQGYYGGDSRYYPPSRGRGGQPAPGATVASDQLALKELGETKAAMAEMRAELKALNDKHDTETTRLRDQLAEEREKAREVRHKADMEMMQQRIELAQQQQQRQPQPEPSSMEKFAWLAPVLVAWLESNGAKSTKAIEMQQSGMKTLLEAGLQQNSKGDPGIEMMKTIVMPMMLKQMDAKSPKALAELYNATTENNLNSVAMMAQLIEAFASNQENEPWWLPMVKETMNGAMGITEHIMQSQQPQPQQPIQMQPGVPAPQQVAPEAQPAAQSAVYTTEEPAQQPEGAVVTPPPEPDRPQTVQQAVMLGMLPKDFQTPEWKTIVLKLHNERDLEKVVNLVTAHLQHLIDFEMLPEMLADIVDNPEEALTRVLHPLPAYTQRKDFVEAVYANVLLALREDGYIVLDVQGQDVTPEQPEQPEQDEPEPQNALKTLEQSPAATG